jgi:AraC family transcriptional regulator
MKAPAFSLATQWYGPGRQPSFVHQRKAQGDLLHLVEAACPPGPIARPALPFIVLYEDLVGGSRVSGDLGGGRFDVVSRKGDLTVAPPNFATAAVTQANRHLRTLLFPLEHWQGMLDHAGGGDFTRDLSPVYGHMFTSPAIRSALRNLWALSEVEGAPSRLLAQAAGCEILAELCRIGGSPFESARGGLAPWAERRILEMLRARYAEDISLEELAAEAELSLFHFARMFRQSVGLPPRVYLTRLRLEKACELLERTDLPVSAIARKVGYSSGQVLARVFQKHRNISPTDYRRAVRDPARLSPPQTAQTSIDAPGMQR